MYRVVYSENAVKDLRRLDRKVAERIIKKVKSFSEKKDLSSSSKALKGLEGKFRFRIGDYRAIFTIDRSGEIRVLMVLNVKHRKDIYRNS